MKTVCYGILVTQAFAISSFAKNEDRSNCQKIQEPMLSGYNRSAGVELNCMYDVGVSASFLYLQPTQDNMELGFIATPSADLGFIGAMDPIHFNFKYKPGFKVAVNFDLLHDGWGLLADYTWFHSTMTTTACAPSCKYIFPTYGHPLLQGASALVSGAQVYNSVSSTWNLGLDLADLSLYRSFYVGQDLTFKTLYGIRGAWIKQTQDVHYYSNGSVETLNPNILNVSNTQDFLHYTSWGVGPRCEIDTNWLFGQGIAFFGNAGADLLYTQYNLHYQDQSHSIYDGALTGILCVRDKNLQFVRAHTDLEFGLTWGSYFANNKAHVDVTAGYGFQVFWDQNMVRKFMTATCPGVEIVPDGNLYLQGLRVTVDFDF